MVSTTAPCRRPSSFKIARCSLARYDPVDGRDAEQDGVQSAAPEIWSERDAVTWNIYERHRPSGTEGVLGEPKRDGDHALFFR